MYTCDFEGCSAEFKKKWQLQEHVTKHTGQKPFKCSTEGCNKAFTRQSHLQRHQQTHSGRKDVICSEKGCGQAFNTKGNLKKHLKRKHSETSSQITCSFEGCGKVFQKKQTLKIHQYEHNNVKPFRCDHEGCDASFLLPSKLNRHVKTHQGYKCTEVGCNEEFSKWSLLRKHVAEDHTSEYKCSKCQKIFYKKYKWRVHMKNHKDSKDVFLCPREGCQYTALRVYELDLHIQNYHEGARPFACQYEGCTKTFGYKHSKLKHQQIVHSPDYVKPQPKPKQKRGLQSKLADYPDEGTRGPRHQWKSKDKGTTTNATKTSRAARETGQVCETTSIHEETDSNQHQSIVMDNVNILEANMEFVTLHVQDVNTAIQELSQTCAISERLEHYDAVVGTKVGALVEIPEEITDENMTNNNMQKNAKTDDSVTADDHMTGHTYMVTKVTLASDVETTGAEALDNLIKAVTKTKNSATKETVETNQGLTAHVMVT